MNNFKTNYKYSIKTRLNKGYVKYVIILFLLIFIVGNALPFIAKLIGDSDPNIVYIYSEDSDVSDAVVSSLNDEDLNYEFKATDSSSSDKLDTSKDQYLINVDNNSVFGTSDLDSQSQTVFQQIFTQIDLTKLTTELNLSTTQIEEINDVGSFDFEKVEDSDYESVGSSYNAYYILNLIIGIFAYMILIFGINYIGSDIVEEKSSRAMEIIVTSTNPVSHFFAKVLAIITYLICLILPIFLTIAITIFSVVKINDYDVSGVSKLISAIFDGINITQFIAYFVIVLVVFLITLLIFISLMGILASTVSNSEEYQKISSPVTLFLVLPYISIYLPFLPDIVLKVASFIPGFALFLMPKLYIENDVNLLFVFIVIFVQLIYLVLIFKYGTKIYREGVLNYSDRKLRKVLKDAFRH